MVVASNQITINQAQPPNKNLAVAGCRRAFNSSWSDGRLRLAFGATRTNPSRCRSIHPSTLELDSSRATACVAVYDEDEDEDETSGGEEKRSGGRKPRFWNWVGLDLMGFVRVQSRRAETTRRKRVDQPALNGGWPMGHWARPANAWFPP